MSFLEFLGFWSVFSLFISFVLLSDDGQVEDSLKTVRSAFKNKEVTVGNIFPILFALLVCTLLLPLIILLGLCGLIYWKIIPLWDKNLKNIVIFRSKKK